MNSWKNKSSMKGCDMTRANKMAADNGIVIFDRQRVRQNRNRARPEHNFLIDWAGKQIVDRLRDVTKNFPLALQMGLRTPPEFAQNLAATGKIETLVGMDAAEKLLKPGTICADEEFLPFRDQSLDLIMNVLSLHSTNDLPGALIQIRRALKPDGLFLAALFGGESLMELRQSLMQTEIEMKGGASPRVFPFADKPQMGSLMQRAGFALPVIDSEIVTVTYPDMFALLKDLRFMGEGNAILKRDKTYPGREFFAKAAEFYKNNFSDEDGRVRASFEVIFLIGWAPHASQQKPLSPGSAKTRLADALNTIETKL
jgi:NADH dehydrogenase [ubiquinone] 1 alpha subcomplex assembly factor 5